MKANCHVTPIQIKTKLNTTGFAQKITTVGNPKKEELTQLTISRRMYLSYSLFLMTYFYSCLFLFSYFV